MQKLRYVSTVVTPTGTTQPSPRQYFDIGRSITKDEAKLFEVRLTTACKHISSVIPCQLTPKGEPCSFYISYGGLDPTPGCKNTQRRLEKYQDDVIRTLDNLVAQAA